MSGQVLLSLCLTFQLPLLLSCSHPRVAEPPVRTVTEAGDHYAILTDGTKLVLRKSAYNSLVGTIGYRFTNKSSTVVYVPVCHVPHHPYLEKYVGNSWILGYSRPVSLCLGEPLAIGPGDTVSYTYEVIHGLPGSNLGRMFHVPEINGTYRMIWRVYRRRDELGSTWDLLPLELRTSNPFTIEIEPYP